MSNNRGYEVCQIDLYHLSIKVAGVAAIGSFVALTAGFLLGNINVMGISGLVFGSSAGYRAGISVAEGKFMKGHSNQSGLEERVTSSIPE